MHLKLSLVIYTRLYCYIDIFTPQLATSWGVPRLFWIKCVCFILYVYGSGGFRGGRSRLTPPLAHAKIIFKDHEMLLTFLMIILVLGDTCKSMLRNSKRQLSLYESFDIISKKGKQIIYY